MLQKDYKKYMQRSFKAAQRELSASKLCDDCLEGMRDKAVAFVLSDPEHVSYLCKFHAELFREKCKRKVN